MKRILIADDHTLVAELCKTLLETEFEVVGIATDGRHLIQAAAGLRPDVVVVDVAMPILNGLDAAERVKQILPSVKAQAEAEGFLKDLIRIDTQDPPGNESRVAGSAA